MRTRIFLVVDQRGVKRIAKKRMPKTWQNERVIELNITVPNEVFTPSPMREEITIQAPAAPKPTITSNLPETP